MMYTIFDCLSAYLQKSKKPQTHRNWFVINIIKQVDWKEPGCRNQSSKSGKVFPKNAAGGYIYKLTMFHNLIMYNLKDILKNVLHLVC